MDNYYQKWIQQEMSWVKKFEKEMKKDARKYSLSLPAFFVIFFGIIGLLTGGIEGMSHNLTIGLAFGILLIPFYLLMYHSLYPSKKHIKSIKEQIDDVLSIEEKEIFAAQMLEADGIARKLSWIDEAKMEHRAVITKDYALSSSPGKVVLVQLRLVKRIIKDSPLYHSTAYIGRGFKASYPLTIYPMYFFYSTQSDVQSQKCDKEFEFSSSDCREQMFQCIREVIY